MILGLIYKELNTLFSSWVGVVAVGAFFVVSGLFLWVLPGSSFWDYGYADPDLFFEMASFLLLFILPLLSVGFFSQEFKHGTIETLRSLPTSLLRIILAKFTAALIFCLMLLVLTIPMISVLNDVSPSIPLDYQALMGSFLGLFLLSACYISFSLLASVISEELSISVIIAIVIGFVFYYGFEYAADLVAPDDSISYMIRSWGFAGRSEDLSKGILPLSTIVYLGSVSLLFIVATYGLLSDKVESV